MIPARYQKSACKRDGWLHKWSTVREGLKGVMERCERCGTQMIFPTGIPNAEYLKYHIRSVLRFSDPLFKKEYPNIKN